LTRKWVGGGEQGAVVLFLPVAAIVFLLVSCFMAEPQEWTRRSFAEAAFLGLAAYGSYALWDNAMRRGNIVTVAAASYLTPFFSTLVSAFYLAVVPGARLWVGCGVLVLGSLLSWRSVSGTLAVKIGRK
jgi:drug/metabolite transporter (DMT)-like permease